MHNITICICSDSKVALWALSSYTISSKFLHQYWLSLQDLSNNSRARLFWVPGHSDIKSNKEADRLARMGLDSHFCRLEFCVPMSASIDRDMNRKWVIDAHSKHWIALNSCRQCKLWIKHPKLRTTKYLCLPKNSSEFGCIVALINISTRWDWQQVLLCILPIRRGDGTSLCVCLSDTCNIENTHFWQAHNECVGIYRGLGIRNSAICFPNLIYDSSINVFVCFFLSLFFFILSFSLFVSVFNSHLGEHIRPKQRPACRAFASMGSGSTLLNPSIHPTLFNCKKIVASRKS
jgi:hypothetical protein